MLPEDQVRFIVYLLMSYPLAFLYAFIWPSDRLVSSNAFKHAYVGILGAVLGGLAYGWQGLGHIFMSAIYSYLFLIWMIRQSGPVENRSWIPRLLFLVMMGHLSFCHIYRQIFNPNNPIDVSGPMMVICIKVTSFSWNVWDGLQPVQNLSSSQKKYAIRPDQFPSLVEYLGFLLFFPTVLVGPALEYMDYYQWITLEWLHHQRKKVPKCIVNPALTFLPAMKRLGAGAAFAVFHVVLSQYFPVSLLISPEFLVPAQSISQILYRLALLMVCCQAFRAKFYFVWLVSEGACIALGAGGVLKDNGGDQLELKWDGLSNQDIPKIEFATNFQSLNRHWNQKTHHWLKSYVYVRVITQANKVVAKKEGEKSKNNTVERAQSSSKRMFLATLSTYVISAFWHGFYPGYYLTFVTGALYTVAERMVQQVLWPSFCDLLGLPNQPSPRKDSEDLRHPRRGVLAILLNIVNWTITQFSLYYIVAPFLVLGWTESLAAWRSVHYCVHLVIFLVILLGIAVGKLGRRQMKKLKVV